MAESSHSQDSGLAGVEKRAHPPPSEEGESDEAAAAGFLEASRVSKGGRFPDTSGKLGEPTWPGDGPGCRALVPYRPRRSSACPPLICPRRNPVPLVPPPPASRKKPAGDIPLEVFPIVFQYMDAATLCSVAGVSREWRKQSNDDRYWRRLCQASFNVTPDAFAPPPDPIKRLYQLQHGSLKAMYRGCSPAHNGALPVVSASTSTQLLLGLMASNAM
ncbi:unnamed protein product [Ascophyllum nodosum]